MDPTRDRGGRAVDVRQPALSIVMPVYNEGDGVEPVLRSLYERATIRPWEVLVVYDFDGDSTVPVVRRLQSEMSDIRLHRNELGPGPMNALRSGFGAARAPYVLVMMADGSDDPGDVDRMYELATSGADVVAASRYMRGGQQLGGPRLKRLLSKAAGLSLYWIGGVPTHDSTNNFKLYSRRFLQSVGIESSRGFEVGLELTVKASWRGLMVRETATTWQDRTVGESHFRLMKWLPAYLRWYWRGLLTRIVRLRRWSAKSG